MPSKASEFGKFRRWGSSISKVKGNPSHDHLALLLTCSRNVARGYLVAPKLPLEPCQLETSDICNDCRKLELQKHFDNNFEEIDRWGFVVADVGSKYHSLGPYSCSLCQSLANSRYSLLNHLGVIEESIKLFRFTQQYPRMNLQFKKPSPMQDFLVLNLVPHNSPLHKLQKEGLEVKAT